MRRLILLLLLGCSCAARPEPAVPFLTHNQSPLVIIYGLPTPTAARLPTADSWTSAWSLNTANMINEELTGDEQLLIDGEIHQFNLFTGYGLNENWSVHTRIPVIHQSGGSLDRFIEKYHEALSLPEGDRAQHPRDRLLYEYQRDGISRLGITESSSGIGDLQIMAARRLRSSAATDVSLWLGLKLPTGDANQLAGSGAADLSIWAAARRSINEHWQLYGTGGILAAGDSELFDALQERTVVFGSAGAQWQTYPTLALKFQFEWHSSFYKNTELRFLDDVLQLTFGGSWQTSPNTSLDIAVAEDIKRDASPDVNFNVTLRVKH